MIATDDPRVTVGEAAAEGYTHVEAKCCQIVAVPFQMMRVSKDTTLGEITARMRCEKCGKPAAKAIFWQQSDARGHVIHPEIPVYGTRPKD